MTIEATNNQLARLIELSTNKIITVAVVLFGLLLILGVIIIINQTRIRKQLRRIQQQLEQKDKPE